LRLSAAARSAADMAEVILNGLGSDAVELLCVAVEWLLLLVLPLLLPLLLPCGTAEQEEDDAADVNESS
jgi:hypothetical protein